MADKKQKTSKYRITQPGCAYGDVGDVVDLTEQQAANMVNKVRSLDAIEAEAGAPSAREAELEKQVASLQAAMEETATQAAGNAQLLGVIAEMCEKEPALKAYIEKAENQLAAKG